VALGDRDQLGHIDAVSVGLAHERGGGGLVTVTGSGGDREAQPDASLERRAR